MNTPQVGQRWMVDTDSALGLGMIVECDNRTLTLHFPATDEERCYSRDNSPITRVIFVVGDNVETIDGERHTIERVESVNNLLVYISDTGEPIPETRLAATLELNHPVKRLLACQLDKPKWFDLRSDLVQAHHRWLRSDVIGLQGARISLTPHQLYVAESATQLGRSRVLLADEVGLGKTIEAGLILQRLLLTDQAQRVLILVPDALRVQWFVELVRCFNIRAVMWGDEVDLEDTRVFIAAHSLLGDNADSGVKAYTAIGQEYDDDLAASDVAELAQEPNTEVEENNDESLDQQFSKGQNNSADKALSRSLERELAADLDDEYGGSFDDDDLFDDPFLNDDFSGDDFDSDGPSHDLFLKKSSAKVSAESKIDEEDVDQNELDENSSIEDDEEPQAGRHICETPWDVVIVDEAHHFDLVHSNEAANTLKDIGRTCEHLLLLSATPERMGLEQHFSRLQLLDDSRFYDFAEFKKQYENYETLADDIAELIGHDSVNSELQEKLATLFPHIAHVEAEDKEDLINLLLDCHGTGRVVYRNTRSAIKGFPERQLLIHNMGSDVDADVEWLSRFVKQHVNEKILFITHNKEGVLDIREWLYRKTGVDCPVFHEGMSLVERDRAAAYFADKEEGAPLLLCSEIGSEGRNFQFCHHLICWDLPEHPDVLEQRIGRLDRIGQENMIQIHACINGDAAAARLKWYHDILNCIEHTNPAAGVMHDKWYELYQEDPEAVGPQVQAETQDWLEKLQNGRDRLLEINSCRQPHADQLVEKVLAVDESNNPKDVLVAATDLLNIHMENLGQSRFSVIPSDQMLVPMVPGIPVEGCEITFDRTTATEREDVQFMTWDHPLMQGLTELITSSDLGVATVALFPNKSLKPGMLFFEAVFKLTIQDATAKQANRYLPESLLRIVVTPGNPKNLHAALPQKTLAGLIENASKAIRKAVVKDYQQAIQTLSDQAQALADTEMQTIIAESLGELDKRSHLEQARMEQLQDRNQHITAKDLEQQQQHFAAMTGAIKTHCRAEMSAVRLLVTYKP